MLFGLGCSCLGCGFCCNNVHDFDCTRTCLNKLPQALPPVTCHHTLSHAFPRSESLALCDVISECALIRMLTSFKFTLHWSGFRWCYLGLSCSFWLSFIFGFCLLLFIPLSWFCKDFPFTKWTCGLFRGIKFS